MRCSPHYQDELGNIKNKKRLEVDGSCNQNCLHYRACLKELGLVDNYKFPVWREENATEDDIAAHKYHLKEGQAVRWKKYEL